MSEFLHGDCIEEMKKMDENSVDSIVTDPPYGLGFMGNDWDDFSSKEYQKFCQEWGEEALRVLKPGGYLLAFSGTRTYHRMVVGLEDAGFEIHDQIAWMYGSGFPKNHDISKAIDEQYYKLDIDKESFGKYLREKREEKGYSRKEIEEKLGTNTALAWWEGRNYKGNFYVKIPSKKNYKKLKQILELDSRFDELIERESKEREVIGKKTSGIASGGVDRYTVGGDKTEEVDITLPATSEAEKWNGWGTALKPAHEPIVVAKKPRDGTFAENVLEHGVGGLNIEGCRIGNEELKSVNRGSSKNTGFASGGSTSERNGRWPANVVLDEKASHMVDKQRCDIGGASRFFYSAKAHKSERNAGLEDLEDVKYGAMKGHEKKSIKTGSGNERDNQAKNNISTLKPINLMRWLTRLVTPQEGTVLDPFAGSGTTGCACEVEGFDYIMIEKRKRFANVIIPKRCEYWGCEDNWSDLKSHESVDDVESLRNSKIQSWM